MDRSKIVVALASTILAGSLATLTVEASASSTFALVTASNPGGVSGSEIMAVSSAGVSSAWAVGRSDAGLSSTAVWRAMPTSKSWTSVATPASARAITFHDVSTWGATAWMLGTSSPLGKIEVLEWTGTGWLLRTPATAPSKFVPSAIVVNASNSVWIVGATNTQPSSMHWNGASWTYLPAKSYAGVGYTGFTSAAMVPGTPDIVAVGVRNSQSRDTGQPFEELWNGSTWSTMKSMSLPGGVDQNGAVTVVSKNDAWYVVPMYNNVTVVPIILRWNGLKWTSVSSPSFGSSTASLVAVDNAGPNAVWAVGYTSAGVGMETPLVERWNGSAWSVVPSAAHGTDSWISGVSTIPGSSCRVMLVGNYFTAGRVLPFGERNC